MALRAIGRGTFVDVIDVTACTGNVDMFTGQFKSRQVVVEGGSCPAICIVAGCAVCTKLAIVGILRSMALIATGRRPFEDIIYVTACTGNTYMFAGQLETGQVVIECCRCPATCRMACTTSRTQLAVMGIFSFVAGIAIGRCSLKNAIGMAIKASDVGMLAG
jgi:hypothetical protein